jgi:pimeloyl-ACP methyl ester carboxylesterase
VTTDLEGDVPAGEDPFVAPPLRFAALEPRFMAESALLRLSAPLLRRAAPDPHPVLILPGLGATDRSTQPLRGVLRRQGHQVHGWGLGRHRVWTRAGVAAVEERLEELHGRYGRPVSLIGVSAGGILARELARANPDAVRLVITVVSPFRHRTGDDNRIARVFSRVRPGARDHFQELPREDERAPLLMPVTALYSRTDGFVDWRSCVETPGPRRDNIEVRTSHLGAASSLGVAIAASDRLACPLDHWRPFQPPRGTTVLFPQFRRDTRRG